MDSEDDHTPAEELEPREPTVEDLVDLCGRLNETGARNVVVGGFAILHSGYARRTMDIDLLVDSGLENEALVYRALESLPDRAVRDLDPGDLAKYQVVRVTMDSRLRREWELGRIGWRRR